MQRDVHVLEAGVDAALEEVAVGQRLAVLTSRPERLLVEAEHLAHDLAVLHPALLAPLAGVGAVLLEALVDRLGLRLGDHTLLHQGVQEGLPPCGLGCDLGGGIRGRGVVVLGSRNKQETGFNVFKSRTKLCHVYQSPERSGT